MVSPRVEAVSDEAGAAEAAHCAAVDVAEDAAWMLKAAPLVADAFWTEAGLEPASCTGWHLPTDVPPADLRAPPAKLRLGHHFERVHAWLLHAQQHLMPVGSNLVMRSRGSTLGEIDCLYARENGPARSIVHREVAVKYYLGRFDAGDADAWWGPEKRDRLDLKLRRLVRHQAVLPRLAREADAWPPELPWPDLSEVFVRGAFFKHPAHVHWPDVAHSECDRGFWCTADEWGQHGAADQPWMVLPKLAWLSPRHAYRLPRQDARDIAQVVERTQRPTLVATTMGPQVVRGFIVPRTWAQD